MKKKNFVSLILSTVGGLLFALGMCMALIPEWNTFNQGIAVGAAGAVILIAMLIVRRIMEGKKAINLNGKAVGAVLIGVAGALLLGLGMCMTMVWESLFIPGIAVGIVGIVVLLCLIPFCKGLE